MRRVIIKSQDQIIILRTWLIMLITANLFLFCTESPLIHSNEGLALEAYCFLMYDFHFLPITLSQMKKKKQRTSFDLTNRLVYRRFLLS